MGAVTAAPEQLATEGGQRCPVCAGHTRPRLDLGDFRLLHCGECGSWASDALVRGAETSFEPESYFDNARLDRDKWEALFDRLGPAAGSIRSVLDVGCGTGAYLHWLRERLPDVRCEGIELDPERAATAARANPQARIHTADALAGLASTRGPFDLITLWDVFEHVPAPARLLAGLADRLSPTGQLYLQTINEQSLVPWLGRASYRASFGRLRSAARRTHEPHHLVFFSQRGLEHAARAASLRIRELWFDRLHRGRMDGHPLVTGATSLLLRAENALGSGLFINVLLQRADAPELSRDGRP
jgi:2-polyprenyl-3-methyl-5-hydroxy-6-metoxy-1,4-benzoquinol methylase